MEELWFEVASPHLHELRSQPLHGSFVNNCLDVLNHILYMPRLQFAYTRRLLGSSSEARLKVMVSIARHSGKFNTAPSGLERLNGELPTGHNSETLRCGYQTLHCVQT